MENRIDIVHILRILYKKSKLILAIVVISCVLCAAVSLLLPNYYQAKTIFYSASTDLAKPEFLFGTSDQSMNFYGTGVDNDRLFTVANSREMLSFLIDSFNLKERYKIKSDSPKAMEKLYRRVSKHYNVTKTKYDAIELNFEDKDPEFAALVANGARNKLDELLSNQIKNKQHMQYKTLEHSIAAKTQDLETISDSLKTVRSRYRIINSGAQSEMLATLITETESRLTRETAKLAALQGSRVKRDTIDFIAATVKGLEKELSTLLYPEEGSRGGIGDFNEGRLKVENLEGRFYSARIHITQDKERQKQIKAAMDADISFVHLVEEATVPLVKFRPKRSIYVITVFFISLFFSIIGVLMAESFKAFDWNAIKNEPQ